MTIRLPTRSRRSQGRVPLAACLPVPAVRDDSVPAVRARCAVPRRVGPTRPTRPRTSRALFSAAALSVALLAAGRADAASASADFGPRHRHFTRSTIHFLGTAEAATLAGRHDLRAAEERLLRRTLKNADVLLARHGSFPPYPAAWEDAEKIAAWQKTTDRLAALRKKAAKALENEHVDRAAAWVEKARKAVGALEEPSGYPPGTFAFLRLRGTAKTARSVTPKVRKRLEKELLDRLSKRRQQFASARTRLLGPKERERFEKRLDKLVGMMRSMVRRDGPVRKKRVKAMHKLYPPFHRPSHLRALSKQEKEPRDE